MFVYLDRLSQPGQGGDMDWESNGEDAISDIERVRRSLKRDLQEYKGSESFALDVMGAATAEDDLTASNILMELPLEVQSRIGQYEDKEHQKAIMNAYLNAKLALLPEYDQAVVRNTEGNWKKFVELKQLLTVFSVSDNDHAVKSEVIGPKLEMDDL